MGDLNVTWAVEELRDELILIDGGLNLQSHRISKARVRIAEILTELYEEESVNASDS